MTFLMRCPFCGAQPEMDSWEVGNFGDLEAGVICRACGATHASAVEYGASDENILAIQEKHVDLWNQRVAGAGEG